jgi:signal transduction histidine kinase
MADKIERAERERELMANQRTQEERSRIARELHDVVAHSVSLMIIQAGAARRSITVAPERAEDALRSLEATGRQAMDELRRVLGVLRTNEVNGTELSPQPSLRRVHELVDDDPSLPIELIETGTPPDDIPPSVELSLFRVVQEALTNVQKHANARNVEVRLDAAPDHLLLCVADDGSGIAAGEAVRAHSHGLAGMRHRMGALGGTLTVGSTPGGGTEIRAVVPRTASNTPMAGPTATLREQSARAAHRG